MGIERGSWKNREHLEGAGIDSNRAGGASSQESLDLLRSQAFGFLSLQRASHDRWFTNREIGDEIGLDTRTTRVNSLATVLASMAEKGQLEQKDAEDGHLKLYRGKEEL